MGEPGKRRKPVVMVVDDEPAVRAILSHALEGHGFEVRQAASGREALAAYRQHGRGIDALLLDVRMPGLDGPGTLRALRDLDPGVRCCFMSGDAGAYEEADLLHLGAIRVLRKPFDLNEVVAALQELTAARPDAAPASPPGRGEE